jgi:hypothetical protein
MSPRRVIDASRAFQGDGGKVAARRGSATRCEIHSPWMNGAHTDSPDFRLDSHGEGLQYCSPKTLRFLAETAPPSAQGSKVHS